MLNVEHISKTFNRGTINEKRALNDLSLSLADGDFVTVIGGNGAGKSTLLNAVAGVWPVDDGKIEISGEDVTGMPEYQRARYIGRVFQDGACGTAVRRTASGTDALDGGAASAKDSAARRAHGGA